MTDRPLTLVLVSTPVGQLGSGRGGGVELTLGSLVRALPSVTIACTSLPRRVPVHR